jgi:hypothetical protein
VVTKWGPLETSRFRAEYGLMILEDSWFRDEFGLMILEDNLISLRSLGSTEDKQEEGHSESSKLAVRVSLVISSFL